MLSNGNWANNNVTIDISMISPKQMIGECLDLGIRMMKELIDAYNSNNNIEPVFINQVITKIDRKLILLSLPIT
jgi:hypothetical protein